MGNPGLEHEHTPHNAGFWLLDEIARKYAGQFKAQSGFHGEVCRLCIGEHDCWLLKPMTYMNRSGQSVNALAAYYRISQEAVLVAHDELDFLPGIVRLKKGGGHGGHNGLRDIMPGLGKDFYRLRIGVGRPVRQEQVSHYLLSRASREVMDGAMRSIDRVLDVLEILIAGDTDKAMRLLHTE